jgi:tetratricopeptide (TPR) repeat protein
MFFVRLRKHAKWMFVFLALVFGLGFVIFGVGSEAGTGIGDLFRDGSGGGDSVSVSEARERVQENPRDAEAKRDLAIALQTEGDTNEAIVVLGDYLNLAPDDASALEELAALYLAKANTRQRDAQIAQLNAGYATNAQLFAPELESGEGQALAPDPIVDALAGRANAAVTAAISDAQAAYDSAKQTYERLAEVEPRDPSVRLSLAQAAQQGGDYPTAIAAYERFLELAPDDPSAPLVEQQIEQLKGAQQPAETG